MSFFGAAVILYWLFLVLHHIFTPNPTLLLFNTETMYCATDGLCMDHHHIFVVIILQHFNFTEVKLLISPITEFRLPLGYR